MVYIAISRQLSAVSLVWTELIADDFLVSLLNLLTYSALL